MHILNAYSTKIIQKISSDVDINIINVKSWYSNTFLNDCQIGIPCEVVPV